MKRIFLDIDGVLNNQRWLAQQHNFKSFSPYNVAALNLILKATGAEIVISSNWRLYPYDFHTLFKRQGIEGKIIGFTPSINEIQNGIFRSVIRGDEIMAYLEANEKPGERFVILDDDDDMGILSPRLVQTNPANGLTEADARRAIEMLGVVAQ